MANLTMMNAELKSILTEVLGKSRAEFVIADDTAIMGAIPEFDSMAVVAVLTAIEDRFGLTIDDDDIDASVFETFATLAAFVARKISN